MSHSCHTEHLISILVPIQIILSFQLPFVLTFSLYLDIYWRKISILNKVYFVTARIRRKGEDTVFRGVCVSTRGVVSRITAPWSLGWGGRYPSPGPGWGRGTLVLVLAGGRKGPETSLGYPASPWPGPGLGHSLPPGRTCHGQDTAGAVCLLRFHAWGLSCYHCYYFHKWMQVRKYLTYQWLLIEIEQTFSYKFDNLSANKADNAE